MHSTCASAARRQCLLWAPLLVLALSASWQLAGQRAQHRAALDQASDALQRARQLDQQAAQLAPSPAAVPELPLALAQLLDLLRQGDARHGVRPGLVSLPGRQGSVIDGPPDAQDLQVLSRAVHDLPALRSVRVDVRATWRNYAGLRAWCAALEAMPLVIRHVVVDEAQVQLELLVLGR